MVHKKHFSLTEARNLLPDLKIKLTKIVELKESLNEKGYDIYKHQFFGGIGPNGSGKFPKDMEDLIRLVHQITEDGVIVKGIDNGLIDFPFIRENGEEVYLCYLHGEGDIEYWHSIKDGFAGRKTIDDL
ncbi:MAG: DUF2203 domain-containing protein [Bacteroidota bacterium]|nr:DUF2203 domain-containing protein [Bacteroidota bacterium]